MAAKKRVATAAKKRPALVQFVERDQWTLRRGWGDKRGSAEILATVAGH
jgi:hypothetical protein